MESDAATQICGDQVQPDRPDSPDSKAKDDHGLPPPPTQIGWEDPQERRSRAAVLKTMMRGGDHVFAAMAANDKDSPLDAVKGRRPQVDYGARNVASRRSTRNRNP